MSNFQIILLAVFGFFILVGVLIFSLYRGADGGGKATMLIWGDIPAYNFNSLVTATSLGRDQNLTVSYVEKSKQTIDADFTEALARGSGPDLIIITQDRFWKNKPKLVPIPYSSVSERDFKTVFIEEGELFLDESGVYGLPLVVDPLVLYYNRDLLSAAGEARPVAYWDEIYESALNLSKIDSAGNLVSSTIALGEARNIPHAKDILSLLMLQAGTPITSFSSSGLRSQVANTFSLPVAPAISALDFYVQFSNPAKAFYSWNRSLASAQTNFASGDAAYYLGFASEEQILRNKNPTLNLGLAPVPQSRASGKVLTFGRLYTVSVARGSRNTAVATELAFRLVSRETILSLSEGLSLPPARRDLLAQGHSNASQALFYDAAIQSRGWLDPDRLLSDSIFREAIESVTSGRSRTFEAVRSADQKLGALVK